MKLLLSLTLAASALTLAAQAAPKPERVRGVISASDATSVTLHTTAGTDVKIATTPDTKYLMVVKSDLKNVTPGSFIGTATKGSGSRMTALEVVVFPPAMRGMGEGHYAWDKIADPTAGGGEAASSMTNGTVESGGDEVASTMTNGNIDQASSHDGSLKLSVSYKGGHKTIMVPQSAPIVAFKPGDRAVVTKGADAFVIASDDGGVVTAKAVAVGQDGLRPPM
jgi:hypothetical protein